MSFWAVARTEPKRERIAIRFLALNGYQTYLPRIGERVIRRGHKVTRVVPLFHGYCFVAIEAQWHAARWSPGVIGMIMDGEAPAHISDSIIGELRARERNGLVVLPDPSAPFMPGEKVRVRAGVLAGKLAVFEGMSGPERVAVLLASLRVTLPVRDVMAVG